MSSATPIISSTAWASRRRREQKAFVAAHPDLYEKKDGRPARLKAPGGKLALGSLDVPGFAVGAEMDFKSMTPMTKGAST